jgi:hypothetical protein
VGVEEGEGMQTKGIDNLFNRIIEYFHNLEKERGDQVQKAYRTPNQQDQKRNTPKHIIMKTLSMAIRVQMQKA